MATKRPRNAIQTRADILAAARRRFGAEGYERTTLRAIAADVGVDAALVIHYFGSKQDLFAEAADFTIELPDLFGVDPDAVADMLLPRFFADMGRGPHLRGAATGGDDEQDRRGHYCDEVFAKQVAPKLIAAAPDHPQQRIGLMGAFIIGLATTRYVLANPPVANLSRDELSRWAAPIIPPAPGRARTRRTLAALLHAQHTLTQSLGRELRSNAAAARLACLSAHRRGCAQVSGRTRARRRRATAMPLTPPGHLC